jgi:hypothetical protein
MTDSAIKTLRRMKSCDLEADEWNAVDMGIKTMEAWKLLEKEIHKLKQEHSESGDYQTGFVNALSNVEGLMRGLVK